MSDQWNFPQPGGRKERSRRSHSMSPAAVDPDEPHRSKRAATDPLVRGSQKWWASLFPNSPVRLHDSDFPLPEWPIEVDESTPTPWANESLFGNAECKTTREERMEIAANFKYPHCASAEKYHILKRVGSGTYGEVFKACEKSNPNNIVAIKKLANNKSHEGFPLVFLREISLLKKLEHNNIVKILEVCHSNPTESGLPSAEYKIIFEYCEYDLRNLLNNKNLKFETGHIKNIMQQLLTGVHFLHSKNILHRDIKSSNILLNAKGVLKLADMGLARGTNKYLPSVFTNGNCICTLWYRSPELLLGAREYGPWIDMWSVGCVFGELCTRSAIFTGNTEQQQLKLISELCGSITPKVWPSVQQLRLYQSVVLPPNLLRRVRSRMATYVRDGMGLDLLDNLLTLAPEQRINASDALKHPYFHSYPPLSELSILFAEAKMRGVL